MVTTSFRTLPVTRSSAFLPERTTRPESFTARLEIPARVAQGDLLTMKFLVTNTGRTALNLDLVCSFAYRVVQAETGRVVHAVPTPKACPSIAANLNLAPGRTGNALTSVWQSVTPAFWDLRDAQGRFVPPGRYVLQAAHGRGDHAIRPPDLPFKVLPPPSDGGVLRPLQVLVPTPTLGSVKGSATFGVALGVQRLRITVPDERARQAILARAQRERITLSRVTLLVAPPAPLPPVGTAKQATLKVRTWSSPQGRQTNLSLTLHNPAASRVLPGAGRCEFVAVVRRVATGEVVYATQGFPSASANHCPTGASLHLPLNDQWDGRLSDGTPAPNAAYEVRAGVRIQRKDGTVAWLSAPAWRLP